MGAETEGSTEPLQGLETQDLQRLRSSSCPNPGCRPSPYSRSWNDRGQRVHRDYSSQAMVPGGAAFKSNQHAAQTSRGDFAGGKAQRDGG